MWAAGNVETRGQESLNTNLFLEAMNDEMRERRPRVGTYLATPEAKSAPAVPDLPRG